MRHQASGSLGSVRVDPDVVHLGFQLGELGKLGLDLDFLQLSSLLVLADLLDGAAALATHLEHVRRHALRHCRLRKTR